MNAASGSGIASVSITTALKQRVALLQAENEELGQMLNSRKLARLYEENKAMRRNVERLEDALRGACAA